VSPYRKINGRWHYQLSAGRWVAVDDTTQANMEAQRGRQQAHIAALVERVERGEHVNPGVLRAMQRKGLLGRSKR
jgi:hypothetical protein